MSFPTVESYLPDLFPFINGLVGEFQAGTLNSWEGLSERVRAFFTPERMQRYESVVPGWIEMASYARAQTLIHVSLVFTGLRLQPEYRAASEEQKRLIEWVVLFHDVAKQPRPRAHDWAHGFRSGAMVGKALPALGFAQRSGTRDDLEAWAALTCSALIPNPEDGMLMHDNQQLPAIIDGIHMMYGEGTPAGIIVKGVLFHMSLDVVKEYPSPFALNDDEIVRYIDPPTLAVLKMMNLADNDGWSLFDPEIQKHQRSETLEAIADIERRLFA